MLIFCIHQKWLFPVCLFFLLTGAASYNSFYVFCKNFCKAVKPGKLRVRCSVCKQGTLTLARVSFVWMCFKVLEYMEMSFLFAYIWLCIYIVLLFFFSSCCLELRRVIQRMLKISLTCFHYLEHIQGTRGRWELQSLKDIFQSLF